MTAPDDAVKAVTALQFGGPWDPWGLTPDEARTVIAAAMPHIRAQIAADIRARIPGADARTTDVRVITAYHDGLRYGAQIAGGEA